MITQQDVVLALSNSGETEEILKILPIIKRLGVPLIAMTGNPMSTLSLVASTHINVAVTQEACPLGLAPTSSTTAALVMGDALAVSLLEARGFTKDDFALSHPGGSLGRRLLLRVNDIMHLGDNIPSVAESALISHALLEMTEKKLGMTAIVNDEQEVVGIFTDGDLRRLLEKSTNLDGLTLEKAITSAPRTIPPELLAEEAIEMMEKHRINHLVVTDPAGALLGALNLHDLFAAKVI